MMHGGSFKPDKKANGLEKSCRENRNTALACKPKYQLV